MNCFSTKPHYAGPVCVTVSILACVFSCSDEAQVKTSIIAPEYSGPVVTWILPETWGENPALAGPMAGSFHVKTVNGAQGRIGVMPFRETVSSLEMANMFAREIGYGTLTDETLAPLMEKKTLGAREFEWIRLEEQKTEESPKPFCLPFTARFSNLAFSFYRRERPR